MSSQNGAGLALSGLASRDFTEADDPIALFRLWLEEAAAAEINDPEAMTLATVDEDGLPDARMVLCKGADARGLVFYGNVESAKGRELAARPKAAALFHWKSLRRQARFRGPVSRRSRRRKPTPISPPVRGKAGSAPGRASSRARSNRGRRWRRRSNPTPDGSATATFPGPPTGAAGGSRRSRSSSGRTAPFACTIESGSPGRRCNRRGSGVGSSRESHTCPGRNVQCIMRDRRVPHPQPDFEGFTIRKEVLQSARPRGGRSARMNVKRGEAAIGRRDVRRVAPRRLRSSASPR